MRRNKGITLIALVITIIVLLILAAVSIATLTGENGILSQANKAKIETRGASVEEECNLWKINQEMDNKTTEETAQTLQELLDSLEERNLITAEEKETIKETGEITIGSKTINFEKVKKTLNNVKVGDYINYGEKLSVQTYITNVDETGYDEQQTFQTNKNMLWRVISKGEEYIEIVPTTNVLSVDNTGLYLKGKVGFVNEEKILKELCEKLYSSETYGTARSIQVNDINKLTNFDPERDVEYYLTSKIFTAGIVWDKESNTFIDSKEVEGGITLQRTDYIYDVDKSIDLYDTLIEESNKHQGDDRNSTVGYWLADRCTIFDTNEASFRTFTILNGKVATSHWLVYSYDWGLYEETNSYGVRPVVRLNSNIEIDTTDKTKNGTSEESAYHLK